ncbi:hypothetical protein F4677DRAFT_205467 [Hypoxylon crocopeplum]|nr:hypothetical protein F4677DRAFT_205467 [Hypoxylon crocopeplum]
MGASFPSIQSFYSREVPLSSQDTNPDSSNLRKLGDGFTSSEVEAVLDPLSRPWNPSRHYETCSISILEPGLRNYQISGRLVNFSADTQQRGYHFLVVSDGSGVISVKLYYVKACDYQLLLGQRVTIWTTFISDPTTAGTGNIPFCASATSILPGRNLATHIILHKDDPDSDGHRIMRCPLECNLKEYDYLPALMTLKAFISSGHDLGEGKLLLCVRSVGPRRTVHSKKLGKTLDIVEVGVFDDTATCVLKIWEDKVASAKSWIPSQTVLLISKPTSKVNCTPPELGIAYNTMINVDPQFPDADWLRERVRNMSKKQSVYVPFPSGTWDIKSAIHGPGRTLFTIAEVEDQVRHPESTVDFTGKLNVIILEMKLMEHWRKYTACCIECCGVPLYSNKPVATCKNCESRCDLTLNPRIMGSVIDESGMIAAGKLVWRDDAWSQLFFGSLTNETQAEGGSETNLVQLSWEELTTLDTNSLRYFEERLLYSRVTLTFGWSSKLERLCILGVEW